MSNDTYLLLTYFAALSVTVLLAGYVVVSLHKSFAELMSQLFHGKPALVLSRMFSSSIWLIALLGFSTISMMSSCAGIDNYADVVVDKVYVYGKARTQISAAASYLSSGLLVWGLVVSAIVVGNKRRRKQNDKADQ